MRFSIREKTFLEQDTTAEQLAVSGEDKDLSWGELEKSTYKFEKKLTELGIKKGQIVCIYGHKQGNFIAAICACIKLGCPYIPMDDIYPEERINKIVSIAKPFCLINLITDKIIFFPDPNRQSFDDIIYIIFTSGSTGEPKGVQITIDNVLSLLQWMSDDFYLPEETNFMNQAPFSFDLSVYELMYTLNFGKTIILNSRDQIKDHNFFLNRLKEKKTNTWISTPSFAWAQCISEHFNEEYLSMMKYFLFCGEVLPVKLVKKLRILFPSAQIYNTYGPTEATVATTLIEITDEVISKYATLPIGYPKKGTNVYIDDEKQICIHGSNVMKGYLNRSDLNESKMFIKNGVRGFKTGDLGFMIDNVLFCQGRMDDQIKIHGYRVELNEIDHALSQTSNIRAVATLPIKRGEEVIRIVAFLKAGKAAVYALFKEEVQKKLPSYMIPSEFFIIEEFPMNANHKIDKNVLMEMYKQGNLTKWK